MDESAGNRWFYLALTCLAVVLSLTTWFSATAVIPELTVRWSLTGTEAAWLTNGVQAGFVVGALTASILSLADIWRMQHLMAGAALLGGIANAALLIEPNAAGAIVARFVTGVALAGVYPPAMKYMATWFVRGRGLALGLLVGSLTLGSAMPHLVRALGAGIEWTTVVGITSLASIGSAAIFLVLRDGPHPFSRTRVDLRQVGSILRNRPVMLANTGYFGHMWELYAMWGWFLAYAKASFATGNSVFDGNASLLTFAVVAIGMPGCIMGGWLSDRIGRCYTTALMMTISGLSALAIGLTFDGPGWLFAAIALVWGLTVVADSAQFSTAVTELSEQHQVGSALALQMGVGFAITILVIWVTPLVVNALGGWRWGFVMLAPGPFVGVWAMLRLRGMSAATAMAGGLR